jgi:hypothetical protein
VTATRTRFISDAILPLVDRLTYTRGDHTASSPAQPAVRVNVAAKMREMWS